MPEPTIVTPLDGAAQTVTPDVTPKIETKVETKVEEKKVVSKDLFDKTATELAELKKQLKAKMTDDEKSEAEKLEAQIKAQEEKERLEEELNTLKKQVETSTLISSTSAARTKVEFGDDSAELKAVMENLNFTTLSALINKLADTAYEKGKKDVTDGVMKKTGDLNLGGNKSENLPKDVSEAIELAKKSKVKTQEYDYFTKK